MRVRGLADAKVQAACPEPAGEFVRDPTTRGLPVPANFVKLWARSNRREGDGGVKHRIARGRGPRPGTTKSSAVFLIALACGLVGAVGAAAEQGWVKGDLRLNLRTGGGNEYRIIGTVATGDRLTILTKGEEWIRVQTEDGKAGWIPAGYLEAVPPPAARLVTAEAEIATLKAELAKLGGEASSLRESNEALSSNDAGQVKELEALKQENFELRAVSRYQEWLTGSGLLGGGMLAGAMLQRRLANRRPGARIRL